MTRTVWRLILCFSSTKRQSSSWFVSKRWIVQSTLSWCFVILCFCLQETTEIAILNLCEYTNRQSIFYLFYWCINWLNIIIICLLLCNFISSWERDEWTNGYLYIRRPNYSSKSVRSIGNKYPTFKKI